MLDPAHLYSSALLGAPGSPLRPAPASCTTHGSREEATQLTLAPTLKKQCMPLPVAGNRRQGPGLLRAGSPLTHQLHEDQAVLLREAFQQRSRVISPSCGFLASPCVWISHPASHAHPRGSLLPGDSSPFSDTEPWCTGFLLHIPYLGAGTGAHPLRGLRAQQAELTASQSSSEPISTEEQWEIRWFLNSPCSASVSLKPGPGQA